MEKNDFSNIKFFLAEFSSKFDKHLQSFIPKKEFFSNRLYDAMNYVISVGGKRLRPIFLIEIANLLGVKKSYSLRTAVSIELIHCYSLVHDDLPAMDNDDLRRGHKTCHKMFDDATAILVGDALQTLAFEIIADKKTHPSAEIRCMLIKELAKSSGMSGMVKGQMLDLVAEKKKLNIDEILELQKLKTGELFRFSCIASCYLNNELKKIKTFSKFSKNLGLAFQIKDDLLDVEGDEISVGKKINKDSQRGKETIVSLLGNNKAKEYSEKLIFEAIKLLEPYGKKAQRLKNLTDFIISRNS